MSAGADPARPSSFPRLSQWLRHHAASVAGTVVDFATMIALVQLLGLPAVVATMGGATAGALTNFSLGRTWAYGTRVVRGAPVARQAARYALVTLASLGLNAGGEHLLADLAGLQYVLARVITAVVVSNAWNYPMQRFFVFAERKASA